MLGFLLLSQHYKTSRSESHICQLVHPNLGAYIHSCDFDINLSLHLCNAPLNTALQERVCCIWLLDLYQWNTSNLNFQATLLQWPTHYHILGRNITGNIQSRTCRKSTKCIFTYRCISILLIIIQKSNQKHWLVSRMATFNWHGPIFTTALKIIAIF